MIGHPFPTKADRKHFISVYGGCAAKMLGEYVRNWNPEQREYREYRIFKTQGFRPLYRITIRPHATLHPDS